MKNLILFLSFSILVHFGFAQQSTTPIELNTQEIEDATYLESIFLFEEDKTIKKRESESLPDLDASFLLLQKDRLSTVLATRPAIIKLSIPFQDKLIQLELEQDQITTSDFTVTSSSTGNEAIEYQPGIHYKGTIASQPESMVAISLFEEEIIGVITTTRGKTLVLGKLAGKDNSAYVLYDDSGLPNQEFACGATPPEDYDLEMSEHLDNYRAAADPGKCVRVYFECDYELYQFRGNSVASTVDYMKGLFNIVSAIYRKEKITSKISAIHVWTSQDPVSETNSSTALSDFRKLRPNFNGNIGHFISLGGSGLGGIAYLNVLCNNNYNYAFSNITSYYNTLPNYSWSVMVVSHEMGHNLGSPHTHNCSWPGGAIDNCWTPQGNCSPGPQPTNGGTIMSYCHTKFGIGINLTKGFGPLPGNLIRSRVYNASCLSACNTVIGESGRVTINQTSSSQWHTVNLNNYYIKPIVIVSPPSNYDADPALVRVRGVKNSSFLVQIDEWEYQDGVHGTEVLDYIVIEQGTHTLQDGHKIQAGRTNVGTGWTSINFNSTFPNTPAVLTQVSSVRDLSAVACRTTQITTTGCKLKLQEEEAANNVHKEERIFWVAMQRGSKKTGRKYRAATIPTARFDEIWRGFTLGSVFQNKPIMLTGMQTHNGGDPCAVRQRNITANTVQVLVQEETSANQEVAHANEKVGYIAFDRLGNILGATKNYYKTNESENDLAEQSTAVKPRINLSQNEDFHMYPNPTSTTLNLEILSEKLAEGDKIIKIYGLTGNLIAEKIATGSFLQINTDRLPKGIFFVKIYDQYGNSLPGQKLVKE